VSGKYPDKETGASAVRLHCPRCNSPLDPGNGAPRLDCSGCGASYSAAGGVFSFVSEMDEFSLRQREIYEGEGGGEVPGDFADPEGARGHNSHCVDIARRTGLLLPTWKGLKSRRVMDRIDISPGDLVLDVGCGIGTLLSTIHAVYGTRGVGIDFSRVTLKAAKHYNPFGNEYFAADAVELPFADGTFDVVVSYDVIEHVSEPSRFVSELTRVLGRGGRLLIYTPSRRSRWTWHWWERVLLGGRYNLGVDNLAGHDPEKFLAPAQASLLMEEEGLSDIGTESFHALFTLIMDEVYPGFIYRLMNNRARLNSVFDILELADSPMTGRGYGNGFFAWGTKS
jgi:2-polyprenyl-3-methyl-5-hydroxy-6-metoxy-1,4-benzoquinol methylase